jgi:hypothetical protein
MPRKARVRAPESGRWMEAVRRRTTERDRKHREDDRERRLALHRQATAIARSQQTQIYAPTEHTHQTLASNKKKGVNLKKSKLVRADFSKKYYDEVKEKPVELSIDARNKFAEILNHPDYDGTTGIAWAGMFREGYKVCESWSGENGLIVFIADMGNRPEGSILVRKSVHKMFCKSNCLWINWKEFAKLGKKVPAGRFEHCRMLRIEE